MLYSLVFTLLLGIAPAHATPAVSIVVVGDSISAGYGIEAGSGWVGLLQQKLNSQAKAYVINNESISGDTTAGGLARIDAVLARHKPQYVLLELGANDGLRGLSPKEMKRNLEEMIRRCWAGGAEVLLLGMKIPPNYGKRYIDMFYQIYPQLSAEMEVPLVPFILEEIALNPAMMQADGLHPNALGQPAIAEKVWRYLEPLLHTAKP